jgi:hypothetical protein
MSVMIGGLHASLSAELGSFADRDDATVGGAPRLAPTVAATLA